MPSKEHLLTSFREKVFFLCKGEPEGDGTRSLELELENARDDEEEEEKKGEDWRKEGIEHVRGNWPTLSHESKCQRNYK